MPPSGLFEPVTALPPKPLTHQFSLACNLTRLPSGHLDKIVAYRGYLRPDIHRKNIISAETAAKYFESTPVGNQSLRNGGTCGTKDLYYLTPYSTYWEYYKTSLMVGNAFLWYPRQADGLVTSYSYRWHHGVAIAARTAAGYPKRRCEGPLALEAAIFDKIARQGKVNVKGGELRCGPMKEEQAATELPLQKEAAIALAKILQSYKTI